MIGVVVALLPRMEDVAESGWEKYQEEMYFGTDPMLRERGARVLF